MRAHIVTTNPQTNMCGIPKIMTVFAIITYISITFYYATKFEKPCQEFLGAIASLGPLG